MKISSARFQKILLAVLILLILINAGVLVLLLLPPLLSPVAETTVHSTPIPPTITPTHVPFPSPVVEDTRTTPVTMAQIAEGAIVLAIRDGNYSHLFAFHPQLFPLTRLTDNPWDDIQPAISPDGRQIAYTSRANGYWDLHILDLQTGTTRRLTDTPQYDGAPSWSPDGLWLVYESYTGNTLDIFLLSIADPAQPPIQLTQDGGFNFSPVWSPGGREIAFVSDRSGEDEIWVARLDRLDDRFANISRNQDSAESHPAWSPDGRYLAWSATSSEGPVLKVWDGLAPESPPRLAGSGTTPAWSPDGSNLLALLPSPNQVALTGYRVDDRRVIFPAIQLPGECYGLDWKAAGLPEALVSYPYPAGAQSPAAPLWESTSPFTTPATMNRARIVPLADINAPYPYLQDGVDDVFQALRNQVAAESGWDLLANLENAFYPITDPPTAGMPQDWLTTGRAFALNPLPLNAGWMLVVREDYSGQTFWRLFVRARFQDGSQGLPIRVSPWDLNARYTNDIIAFEQGGRTGSIPAGYWIDFTEIANRYGWERLPALQNWRSYYRAARFNLFAFREGLDWVAAMAQLYPPEALATPTGLPTYTPTATPTVTPRWRWATLTFTPTPTSFETPTPRPTWTQLSGTNQP